MKHELLEVKWGIVPIAMYKGVLITRIIGGYSLLNKKCKSPEEVDIIIKESLINLKSTIK